MFFIYFFVYCTFEIFINVLLIIYKHSLQIGTVRIFLMYGI